MSSESRRKSRVRYVLLGIGAIGFALLFSFMHVDDLVALGRPDLKYLAAFLVCLFLFSSIAGVRWALIIRHAYADREMPMSRLYLFHMLGLCGGMVTTDLVGHVGVKPLLLKRHFQIPLLAGGALSLLDKLTDIFLLAGCGLAVLLPGPARPMDLPWAGRCLLIGGMLSFLMFYAFSRMLPGMRHAMLEKRLGHRGVAFLRNLSMPMMAVLCGMTMVRLLLFTAALEGVYLAVCATGQADVSYAGMLFGSIGVQLGGMLSFVPGGLGIAEYGLIGALHLSGASVRALPRFAVARRIYWTLGTLICYLGARCMLPEAGRRGETGAVASRDDDLKEAR